MYLMIPTFQPLLGGVSLKPPYGGHISGRGGADGLVDGGFQSYLWPRVEWTVSQTLKRTSKGSKTRFLAQLPEFID